MNYACAPRPPGLVRLAGRTGERRRGLDRLSCRHDNSANKSERQASAVAWGIAGTGTAAHTDENPRAAIGCASARTWVYRDPTHCGPWFLTLLIVVLIGRAVIRSESNGTSGISSPASQSS